MSFRSFIRPKIENGINLFLGISVVLMVITILVIPAIAIYVINWWEERPISIKDAFMLAAGGGMPNVR